jgi:DNA replication protein
MSDISPVVAPFRTFSGFAAGARSTFLPSAFFSELLPLIEDDSELKVTLYAIYALARRKGYPRFVTARELRAEGPLMAALGGDDEELGQQRLRAGLLAAVKRGSLLRFDLDRNGKREALFFLNTPSSRRAVEQMRAGRLQPRRPLPPAAAPPAFEKGNVFQLYEENIGPLTPIIAEELKEAEQLYPAAWLEEAMREAALLNKRSWRYVAAILRRWAAEGRRNAKTGQDTDTGNSARSQILRRYRDLVERGRDESD